MSRDHPARPAAHPAFQSILRRITQALPAAVAWSGSIYRSVTPRFANRRDLLSGEGSARWGGRWNPPGIATVYGSLSPETAMAEALAHVRYYHLPIGASMPRVFVEIEVKLQRVLDLRDGGIRQRLRVSERAMRDDDWRGALDAGRESLTQAIGRGAFEAGLEGLLAPSAADPHGHNLIAFPVNLLDARALAIVDADRLTPTTGQQ